VVGSASILTRMTMLFEGLRVFPDRMRENLDRSGGLIMSEALMLELGAAIGRQHAHDAIYDAAQEAAVADRSFRDLLLEDATVADRLDAVQLEALLDPERYTGECATVAVEQAARAREVAAGIRG
jgi:adenylosuccinate lyase